MIEALIRTKSALEHIPFLSDEQEGLISEWYNQLLYPNNPLEDATGMNLKLRADFNELICYAKNRKKVLATQFLEIMEVSKFPEMESTLFKKVYKSLKGTELSCWLKVSEMVQESGWQFDGMMPLETALKAVPKSKSSKHKELFTDWYAQQDADAAVKLGRAVSSSAYTFLHTELFGGNASEDLEIYTALMQQLEITPLPTPLLDLILDEDPEFIELCLHFASNGIIRAGLKIPNPSQALVIKLSLVLGGGASDNLGAFEGSLGETSMKSVELYRNANGVHAGFSY